ncbi:MAG: copper amine oxidase N-terminal domain-containing protein [Firmicutes bacterium]|nr:copper amine oxidase N-terminal domain-containing protein [Bacillota bacterium]
MRRKIALLLAFVMTFSLLPMAVGATSTGIIAAANRTGSLFESGGPANNVRDWGNGVIVAREDIVRTFTQPTFSYDVSVPAGAQPVSIDGGINTNLAPAPGGNLRHIMVASDYFVGAGNEYVASLLVQLQNTRGWALAQNGTAALSMAQVEDARWGMPGLISWLQTPPAQRGNNLEVPGADPVPALLGRASFDLGWGDLPLTTTAPAIGDRPDLVQPSPNPPATSVFLAFNATVLNALNLQVMTHYNMEPVVAGLVLVGSGAPGDLFRIVWAMPTFTVPASADADLTRAVVARSPWWITQDGDVVENARVVVPNDNGVEMPPVQGHRVDSILATPGLVNAMATAIGDGSNVIAFGAVGVNQFGRVVAGTTVQPRPPGNVDTDDTVEDWFISALVLASGTNQAFLHIWRTANFPITPPGGSGAHFIALPQEYVTHGDTNSNPIHLLFTHHGGWAQAGQTAFRTDLTVVSESTFQITRNGGPRNFHRYGTVLVGGEGRADGIRIREGAQGAFDQTEWFVEIEIITPGFFWTALSEDNLRAQNNRATNGDVSNNVFGGTTGPTITTRYTAGGNNLGGNPSPMGDRQDRGTGITTHDVRRGPEGTTNVANRWNTLYFGLTIPNATNINRLVNDEINIRGLYIGADDRARPGVVEAEVRFYRAGREAMGTGTTAGFMWQPGANAQPLTPAQVSAVWATLPQPTAGRAGIVAFVGDINTTNVNFVYRDAPAGTNLTGNDAMAFTAVPLTWGGGAGGRWTGAGDPVQEQVVTLANYGSIGLEWFVHENDDAADFVLRSGMQAWTIDDTVRAGGQAIGHIVGAVVPNSPDNRYHLTARGVLRETVAGSMPGTGASPITFTFNEGIEILGVRFDTNEGHFSRAGEDNSDGAVWFGLNNEADNFLSTTLGRNSVTIRPEIGQNIANRWRNAQITLEFYLSIMPGYEHFFGFDEIEVTAAASVDGQDWEETITIAYAWDPITVETSPLQLDDQGQAVAGIIRNFTMNDVVIHEVEAGALYVGTRLWVGVEGGVSRSWGSADHISIGSFNVTVEGDDSLQVSPPRQDSHGTFVEILRASRNDGARIVFSDIQVAGNVFPDRDYNIFVADDAVAANWDGFNWLNAGGATGVGFSRGAVRGFFSIEPYSEPAFSFAGAEVLLPGPGTVTPTVPTVPGGGANVSPVPVTLFENQPYIIRNGPQAGQAISPSFQLVPVVGTNPPASSSFISVAAIADILGWEINWDPAGVATFTTPDGRSIVFTNGQSTFTVNGATMQMAHQSNGTPAPTFIANDRLMVHIRAFELVGARVNWIPTPGNPGIVVTP